ncbi:MAG: hypothetical protein ACLGI3_06695 [Actinomycetes bacterium]
MASSYRVLLTVALALGLWFVLAAWAATASAETAPTPGSCAALPVEAAPLTEPTPAGPPLADPTLADPVAFTDPTVAEPTPEDPVAFAEPVVVDPAAADSAVPAAVEPVPVDSATTGVSPAPPTCEAAPAPAVLAPPEPVLPPAEVSSGVLPPGAPEGMLEPVPTSLPADDGLAAPAEPVRATADITPTASLDDLRAVMTGDLTVDAAPVDAAPVDALPVDAEADLEASAQEDAAPVFCSQPESDVVQATDPGAAAIASSGADPQPGTANGSVATGTTVAPVPQPGTGPAAALVSQDSTPAAPASPPAPVRVPPPLPPPAPTAPVGPPGPAGPTGSSAAASSGASCHGGGQNDHSDGIDAVLEAQVALSLAQAALRPSAGFAGSVVGGADDPGASPG